MGEWARFPDRPRLRARTHGPGDPHRPCAASYDNRRVLSVCSGFAVGDRWWWRMRVGGREPSAREQQAYNDAIAILDQHTPGQLPCPADWFVLDLPDPEAATCGQTLMLTHTMLEAPSCRRSDTTRAPRGPGRPHDHSGQPAHDTSATRTPSRSGTLHTPNQNPGHGGDPVSQHVVAVGVFALSANSPQGLPRWLGLWLLHPLWGHRWRKNEYTADQYAASLGLAEELADFLETNALIYDQPVPFAWLTPHTHPATELRIDRLRAAANTRSEPSFAS